MIIEERPEGPEGSDATRAPALAARLSWLGPKLLAQSPGASVFYLFWVGAFGGWFSFFFCFSKGAFGGWFSVLFFVFLFKVLLVVGFLGLEFSKTAVFVFFLRFVANSCGLFLAQLLLCTAEQQVKMDLLDSKIKHCPKGSKLRSQLILPNKARS